MAHGPSSQDQARARSREYIAVGRVVRPHGVRGALLVEAISEMIHSLEPSTQLYLGREKVPAHVQYLRSHQDRYLLAIEGCQDREEAERWRGQELYLATGETARLPEGTYFHWQILGLEAVSEHGETLGEIVKILETGANDVYVVETPEGGEILLPAIESVILEVDLERGVVVVHLLPGLRPGGERPSSQ